MFRPGCLRHYPPTAAPCGVRSPFAFMTTMSTAFDLYLSEMSVSDKHGGGLTLQRVLGSDLDHIGLFAHVHKFGADLPAAERFQARCVELPAFFQQAVVHKIIRSRIANWLDRSTPARAIHARSVAQALSRRLPGGNGGVTALVCPQGAESLYAVEALLRRRQLQYVTWVMDDHLARWRDGALRYPPGLEVLFAKHLRGARSVFTISPAMAYFYRERFGVESRVLFGPATSLGPPVWSRPRAEHRVRLGYFGALGRWQLDALNVLARYLARADAELDVYSSSDPPPTLQTSAVSFKGRLAPHEVSSTMRGYDAVVLPVSSAPELRHMSQLNIATKMSECLASGTVTLAIAPPYAAMVRFLEERGAAILVLEETASAVQAGIEQIRDDSTRRKLIEAARALAEGELSSAAMHSVWTEGIAPLVVRATTS